MFCSNCVIYDNNRTPELYNVYSTMQPAVNSNPNMESYSINVKPDNICKVIDTFISFGWSLLSIQEIHMKDSQPEFWRSYISALTESEYYYKLIFKRDKSMKNYNKIRELEDEYYRIDSIIRLNCIQPGYAGRNKISHFKLFIAWYKSNNKMNAFIIPVIIGGIIIPIIGAVIVLPVSMIVLFCKFKKEVREKSIEAEKLIPLLDKLAQDAEAL